LGISLAYVRARRIKALKFGISLVIAAATVVGPAILLLRSHQLNLYGHNSFDTAVKNSSIYFTRQG
jgi:hypothetical protein